MLHHRRGILRSFEDLKGTKYGLQAPRIGRNGAKRREDSSEIDFNLRAHQEDDSGISSPPMWETSSPMNPKAIASIFHHVPATPRSQAIAKGRQELMEMMRGVPETAYELSLKDLVELNSNKRVLTGETTVAQEDGGMKKMTTIKSLDRRYDTSRNLKSGPVLLKMSIPAALVWKKKRNGTGSCSKVSPKPPSLDGEKVGSEKSVDGECWKMSPYQAEEKKNSGRSSGGGSSSSSSRKSRKMGGLLPGCFSFFARKTRA